MADQFKKKPAAKKRARDEFEEEEIFQAPVIVREPTSRQAKLGGKVVIRITATGKPLPSYQWFHNGKKIVGATTDRLTLSKLRRTAAGAYHCEAKNHAGKATSRVCMLSFFTQRVPKLVVGPELSKVEEGKPFVVKVTSPPASELREFKIYWIFNGMRIKGAHGPELSISAMKKKYEGEYKAMIATGGSLETSNVAKLVMKPAKSKAEHEPVAEEESQSLEDVLAQEPTREMEAPVKKPAPRWEDFTFNPEEEEEGAAAADEVPEDPEEISASLVAPLAGSEAFGNTSPGTPGAPKSPISQLGTEELIRAVAAQGGASELLESVEQEEPSGLILSAELKASEADPSAFIEGVADAAVEHEDPSGLIEASSLAPQADPLSLIEASRKIEAPAPKAAEEAEEDDLIQDWGIAPSKRPLAEEPVAAPVTPIRAAPKKPAPSPKLVRKKEFLESLLGKWQSRTGRKTERAA